MSVHFEDRMVTFRSVGDGEVAVWISDILRIREITDDMRNPDLQSEIQKLYVALPSAEAKSLLFIWNRQHNRHELLWLLDDVAVAVDRINRVAA